MGPPAVWALISTFGALAWFPVPGRLSGGAAYNEIYLVALAGCAAQAPCPIDNGGIGTISRDLICYIGLGAVPATLAPHDQPDLGGKRLAQGHRRRLALASIASHHPAMTPDLTDDDKATHADRLRETSATASRCRPAVRRFWAMGCYPPTHPVLRQTSPAEI